MTHNAIKSRERFNTLADEQAEAIISHAVDPSAILYDLESYVDPAIVGKMGNSPVFLKAIRKRIEARLVPSDPVPTEDREELPLPNVKHADIPSDAMKDLDSMSFDERRMYEYVKRFLNTNLDKSDDALRFIMLAGPGGSGKTTAVRMALTQIGNNAHAITIGGNPLIKPIRDAIQYAERCGRKVVLVMEECENLSKQASSTLKDAISSIPSLMIVGTSNYPERIDPALLSRATVFRFNRPSMDDINRATADYWNKLTNGSVVLRYHPIFWNYREMRQWLKDEADGIGHDDTYLEKSYMQYFKALESIPGIKRESYMEYCSSAFKMELQQ